MYRIGSAAEGMDINEFPTPLLHTGKDWLKEIIRCDGLTAFYLKIQSKICILIELREDFVGFYSICYIIKESLDFYLFKKFTIFLVDV